MSEKYPSASKKKPRDYTRLTQERKKHNLVEICENLVVTQRELEKSQFIKPRAPLSFSSRPLIDPLSLNTHGPDVPVDLCRLLDELNTIKSTVKTLTNGNNTMMLPDRQS